MIKSLKFENWSAYDEISNRIIKLSSPFIISPLTHICNAILNTGNFPHRLKFTVVKPLWRLLDRSVASCFGACVGRMRRLPGVAWPQCGSWLAAWPGARTSEKRPVVGAPVTQCVGYGHRRVKAASCPVSWAWPPDGRGSRPWRSVVPATLKTSRSGPTVLARWMSLTTGEVHWWSEHLWLLAGSCVFYTNLGGAKPRLVTAAVSADWSAKRSWIWLVVERCINTSAVEMRTRKWLGSVRDGMWDVPTDTTRIPATNK
jgi:hypothetical protein